MKAKRPAFGSLKKFYYMDVGASPQRNQKIREEGA